MRPLLLAIGLPLAMVGCNQTSPTQPPEPGQPAPPDPGQPVSADPLPAEPALPGDPDADVTDEGADPAEDVIPGH